MAITGCESSGPDSSADPAQNARALSPREVVASSRQLDRVLNIALGEPI